MKILCENKEIEKDMQDLVNLFYSEDDNTFSIQHSDKTIGGTTTSKIEIINGDEKKEYVKFFSLPQNLTPLREKSLRKSNFKNHLYQVLSSISKKTLPWGSLTGVRPCKFVREMVERGEVKEHLIPEMLMKEFYVKEDKARLVLDILRNQKCIIKTINLSTFS